jgi:hypothetical protein
MYGSNTSTDSSMPFATTSANSQARKRSDLSCVGKLFFKRKKQTNKSSILSFDKIVRVFSIVIEKVFYKY